MSGQESGQESEEEKEAIRYIQGEIKDLLNIIECFKEYQNILEKEEVHLKQTILNLIDKLQKENTELKEELDYYKQKENQEFDERDYYEE